MLFGLNGLRWFHTRKKTANHFLFHGRKRNVTYADCVCFFNRNEIKVCRALAKISRLSLNNPKKTLATMGKNCVSIWQIDSMLPCVCSVIDHRWRQNFVRIKKVAHEAIAECVTDVFTAFWRLLWSIFLNRRTATWNLFVLYNKEKLRDKAMVLGLPTPILCLV